MENIEAPLMAIDLIHAIFIGKGVVDCSIISE
jgi:hypothetical protein